MAVVGPSTSVSGGLSQGYGSASGQLNPAIYSSGLGNTGMGAVAHSFDLGPEELDSGPAKQLRCSFSSFYVFHHTPKLQLVIILLLFFLLILCMQYFSVSSMHAGMADGLVQHNFENDAVVASFPSASASDLQSAEPPNAVKVSKF